MKIYSTLKKQHKKLPVFEGYKLHNATLTGMFDRFFIRPLFKDCYKYPVRFITKGQFKDLFELGEQDILGSVDISNLYSSTNETKEERRDDWIESKIYTTKYIKDNMDICHRAVNIMILNKINKLNLQEVDYPNEECSINDLPYSEYLQTGHRQRIRELSIRRDGGKCVLCSSDKKLHGHHRSYNKKGTKTEFTDVYTLCERCHKAYHSIISKEDGGDLEDNVLESGG